MHVWWSSLEAIQRSEIQSYLADDRDLSADLGRGCIQKFGLTQEQYRWVRSHFGVGAQPVVVAPASLQVIDGKSPPRNSSPKSDNDTLGAAIVPVLGCVLTQLCERNDLLDEASPKWPSKFHCLRPPCITVKDYLVRISQYSACSGECFVLALVYIDRLIQTNPSFVVTSLNIHRLLITSVMLAAKFFDDQYVNNAYYAKVGGVPRGEMNSLEVEFLFMANFSLFVPSEQYRQYYTELGNHAKHSACDCSKQASNIPELKFPLCDAVGTCDTPLTSYTSSVLFPQSFSSSMAPSLAPAPSPPSFAAATAAVPSSSQSSLEDSPPAYTSGDSSTPTAQMAMARVSQKPRSTVQPQQVQSVRQNQPVRKLSNPFR